MSEEVAKERQSSTVRRRATTFPQLTVRQTQGPWPKLRFSAIGIAGLLLALAAWGSDCPKVPGYYQHTKWTLSDGAPPDIWSLAQSPDGYLWLGTGAGLYRFDGTSFQRIEKTAGSTFPAVDITALLALPSGDIWIGYQSGGASRLRQGTLTNFSEGVPKGSVHQFAEDQDHSIWMMSDDGLARFANGRWREVGSDWGFPARSGNSLFVGRNGTLWVTISSGKSFLQEASELAFLPRGAHRFELSDKPVMVAAALAQDSDGTLWVSDPTEGARELDRIPAVSTAGLKIDRHQPAWAFRPLNLLFDDEGGLWGIHHLGGIFRLPLTASCSPNTALPERMPLEIIDVKEELTSNISASLLKDREGNIWVGTNLGLDRFARANVVPMRGIPLAPDGYRETRGPGGSVYVTSHNVLFRIDANGTVTSVLRSPAPVVFLQSSTDGHALWLGTQSNLSRLVDGKWTRIALPHAPSSSFVSKIEASRSDDLWIAMWGQGIYHWQGHQWQKWDTSPTLPSSAPLLMASESSERKWLYYASGTLVLVEGTSARSFSSADGPGIGNIQAIVTTPSGVLLGGEFGIAAFDGKRFHALRSSVIPSFSRISGIVRTSGGETWLNGIMGLVRVRSEELDAVLTDPSRAGSLSYRVLDFRDGLPGLAQQDSFEPTAIEGSDHRLWFITNHGIASVDPSHMVSNLLPPPVMIRSVTAGGVQYPYQSKLAFPNHVVDLQLDYTALSLTIPERVRFRYQLSGADDRWIDPSGRRQAFYTNLPPGRYQFRVIAANNDGVWNRAGASMELFLPPTFVQTRWFTLLCAVAGILVLWIGYSLRLRQISSRMSDRAQARLAERERIARELHDTLLQGFQGLVLRFQAVASRLPPESPGRHLMKEALERADDVIVEGRERVQNLRGVAGKVDLPEIFKATTDDFVAQSTVAFRVSVSGASRPLHPIVLDEVIKIGNAALFNAFQHASAQHIDVDIQYARHQLHVRTSDDGVGFDPALIAHSDQPDLGFKGMKERARRIHAELKIWSRPGRGTKVELTVPGSIAYPALRGSRVWQLFRRGIGDE